MNTYYESYETKIYKAFLQWTEEGKKLCLMFEQNGIPLPAELVRAFKDETQASVKRSIIAPPLRPDAPPNVDGGFWIEAKEAVLSSLIVAILNEGKAVPTKELIDRIKTLGHNAKEGSVYNVGCKDERIVKAKDGWELRNGAKAPTIYRGYLWGGKEVFQKPDLASFRRMAIHHLLKMNDRGLQAMELLRQLQSVAWLNTPLNKDLIKADLVVMAKENKIRRKGFKWIIATESKPSV